MTIAGVASAFPKHQYDQRVLLSALQRHWGPKIDNPVFMERLQARVGVNTPFRSTSTIDRLALAPAPWPFAPVPFWPKPPPAPVAPA